MVTDAIRRYLVDAHGPDIDAVRKGLAQAHMLAKDAPAKRVVLVTPTKQQLRYGTIVDAIGQAAAVALSQGRSVPLPNGIRLSCETQRTFHGMPAGSVILAVYGRPSLLDTVETYPTAYGIVVVPWMESDVEEWIRAWNPEVVGVPPRGEAPPLIENAVVGRALITLTNGINLSTGLHHPSDRNAAIQLLRMLRDSGEEFDPAAIRAWALRNGWSPDGANDLRDVAQAVLDRRPIRGGKEQHWRPDLIDRLRDEVRDDQD